MKYENYRLTKDNLGYEFATPGVMKGSKKQACMHCGNLTEFIDVCSEGHICSDECMDAWYKMFSEMVNSMEEGDEIDG